MKIVRRAWLSQLQSDCQMHCFSFFVFSGTSDRLNNGKYPLPEIKIKSGYSVRGTQARGLDGEQEMGQLGL